jgi:hypothetical protein
MGLVVGQSSYFDPESPPDQTPRDEVGRPLPPNVRVEWSLKPVPNRASKVAMYEVFTWPWTLWAKKQGEVYVWAYCEKDDVDTFNVVGHPWYRVN